MKLIFCFLLCLVGSLNAQSLEKILALEAQQKKIERVLIFKSKQLLFLNELQKYKKIKLSDAPNLTKKYKGKKLSSFVAGYGFPNVTFRPHSMNIPSGGIVVWDYDITSDMIFRLVITELNNELIIKHCYFFDPKKPRKPIIKPNDKNK